MERICEVGYIEAQSSRHISTTTPKYIMLHIDSCHTCKIKVDGFDIDDFQDLFTSRLVDEEYEGGYLKIPFRHDIDIVNTTDTKLYGDVKYVIMECGD